MHSFGEHYTPMRAKTHTVRPWIASESEANIHLDIFKIIAEQSKLRLKGVGGNLLPKRKWL